MEQKQYILAVPNFSEGTNHLVINEAVEAVRAADTAEIIKVEPEANFNRTVLTFIIEAKYGEEAMIKMADVIFKHVNMEIQTGDHPRIGALDILPIFPLKNITMEETVELAANIGQSLFEHTKVPIYFSGLNAKTTMKKSIASIRQGQYEGLKALLEEEHHPDVGSRKPDLSVDGRLDPKKGASIVMADVECPIAYNIFIASEEIESAKEISRLVKSTDYGWPSIKSIGFKDESKSGTAVSMNVSNASETPLVLLYKFIKTAAQERGTKVIAAEIVGPIKRKCLVEAAKSFGYEQANKSDVELVGFLEANMNLMDFEVKQIIESYLDENDG